MQGKQLINDMIYTYFMLVTMILAVMWGLGTHFMPDVTFGYKAFSMPLIYAAYGTVPNIVMYARKELTPKQFLIRKAIQLVLVEIIVIKVAVPNAMMEEGKIEVVVLLAISILVVFIFTHLIEWFQNYTMAKKMTEELLFFQQNHKNESGKES